MIYEIVKFGIFPGFSELKILGTFRVRNFWNFANRKFSEFSELRNFGNSQIGNFWIFYIEIFQNFPKF